MKTQILYEDNDIIVCYKPAGIAVQTAGIAQQDMVSELKNYLAGSCASGKGQNKQAGGKEPYVAVVHRLDQPVSGVLVFAKNKAAAASLSAQVQDGRAEKIYRAMVCGTFEEAKEGILEDILYKDVKSNTSRVVQPESKEAGLGKKAKLAYKVLQELSLEGQIYSELEIKLYTGRHHQIRVQLSHAGHSILGDTKYGSEASKALSAQIGKGLKLCAYRLTLIHPKTGEKMTFTAPQVF